MMGSVEFEPYRGELVAYCASPPYWIQIWYAMLWNQRGSSLPWPGALA